MTNPPTQRGGVALPADFAEVLRVLREVDDPRLPATLTAAHEAGWTYRLLAHALGAGPATVRQIAGRTAPPGQGPIPGIPPAPKTKTPTPSATSASRFTVTIGEARDAARMRAWSRLADTVQAAGGPADEPAETARAERAERGRRAGEERAAEEKFLALCRQRFLKPLKDQVDAEHEDQRWYRCTKCRKKVLRDAVNPYTHRCF